MQFVFLFAQHWVFSFSHILLHHWSVLCNNRTVNFMPLKNKMPIPEIIYKVACYKNSCSTKTSMTMNCYLAFLQGKWEHLHHIQQVCHGGITEVFPSKVVMINAVFHKVFMRIICKSWRFELWSTASMFSWDLKIYHRSDTMLFELAYEVKGLKYGP